MRQLKEIMKMTNDLFHKCFILRFEQEAVNLQDIYLLKEQALNPGMANTRNILMYYSWLSWSGWWRNTPLYTYFGQIGKDIWCHISVCEMKGWK